MWEVWEHRRVDRQLSQLPLDVQKRYEKWKDIVKISGPHGLKLIKGFHDESLRGKWRGHRSSRLSQRYRVLYRVEGERLIVEVVGVTSRLQKEVVMGDFHKAGKRIEVSVGESVRIMRKLQELSQNRLAELTGIPQSTISAIERNRVNLGVERAKVLARALKVHPAVLVFPSWDVERESAA